MTEEPQAVRADLLACIERLSLTVARMGHPRRRPILGGVFGPGAFDLTSLATLCDGLDEVHYSVSPRDSQAHFGAWTTKAEALAFGRRCVSILGYSGVDEAKRRVAAAIEKARLEEQAERDRQFAERVASLPVRPKSIPKRRREIFDASEGQCHYCKTTLTLDGRWHIEHMQPKALLGPNERSNLVASCVSCNNKKRDMTAEEFIAKRGAQ
jgi:5-methylcytosine-specific restriction endonuclease McrA